ncbi:hypothetical protein SODALDRAFT_201002 [Sodiomyces alkalinus F11]|uniref:Uncharacterized protein n=1 Tax=Sodiomyces alkalinus (strain CBS 110278 / VKM F-3762 / F11) TaxID=1314773 RepID=A0A3N2PTG4_SODAK|nr:hypothetical protein SODALDRAFT_201002 [Sodiomyces alkalinus F11]ROT37606.1 hypothetical protein SODALDRAFT_201002 [Sodiomyces alkalinus F11]
MIPPFSFSKPSLMSVVCLQAQAAYRTNYLGIIPYLLPSETSVLQDLVIATPGERLSAYSRGLHCIGGGGKRMQGDIFILASCGAWYAFLLTGSAAIFALHQLEIQYQRLLAVIRALFLHRHIMTMPHSIYSNNSDAIQKLLLDVSI